MKNGISFFPLLPDFLAVPQKFQYTGLIPGKFQIHIQKLRPVQKFCLSNRIIKPAVDNIFPDQILVHLRFYPLFLLPFYLFKHILNRGMKFLAVYRLQKIVFNSQYSHGTDILKIIITA